MSYYGSYGSYGGYQSPRISPCVKGIIITNVVFFILQLLPFYRIGDMVTSMGALNPVLTFMHLQFWRPVTYMFMHSPNMIFHILFNMLALYWFGMELEDIWGRKKFLFFYFLCGVGAGLFSLVYIFINPYVWIVGASGAVLGVMTAYAHYYPDRQVLLFFVIPVRIKTIVWGYVIISVLMSLNVRGGGTSHLTHLGGILIAWAYLKWFPALQIWINRQVFLYNKRKREKRG